MYLCYPCGHGAQCTSTGAHPIKAMVIVTMEIVLDNKAIHWNRNPMSGVPIACATSYLN